MVARDRLCRRRCRRAVIWEGSMSQRIAAIDCGTNSIRLLVSDVGDGVKSDVTRQMRIVRLGQGVDQTGVLAADAVERTMESVREYAQMIAAVDVDRIRCCGTCAARGAANAAGV